MQFLVAISDDQVSSERGHRVWRKVGTIAVLGRRMSFSDDYNKDLPDAVCAEISKAVNFFLDEPAAIQTDFRPAGFEYELRVTRF